MFGYVCLTVAMFLGSILFIAPGSAQTIEDELLREQFRVESWVAVSRRAQVQFYGQRNFNRKFQYQGKDYTVTAFRSGGAASRFPGQGPTGGKVNVIITPKFPPDGVRSADFTMYLGSSGKDLDSFNFGDASASDDVGRYDGSSEWYGTSESMHSGYVANDFSTQNGIIVIAKRNIPEKLQFAKRRPTPTETSGRIEAVSDLNDDEKTKKWRICNKGFGVEEAKVACRQLGLETSGAKPLDLSTTDWLKQRKSGIQAWVDFFEIIALNITPVLFENLECTGDEARLVDCNHSILGVFAGNTCPLNTGTAAVICGTPSSDDNNNAVQCPCGTAPNGKCWATSHCGQGGGFGE